MKSIPKSSFTFLNKITKNNNRDWFTENKPTYQIEYDAVKSFFQSLKETMQQYDEIEDVRVHRIYRDIRFSKDKTPYKTHFSGGLKRAGKFKRGGYYLHLEPDNSLVAGGFFSPNKEDLLRIRKEIEFDAKPFYKLFNRPSFLKHFGDVQGDELKSAPRGFPKDHIDLALLRKKSFYFTHKFTNSDVHSIDFQKSVISSFRLLRPYFDFMSEVLSTNLDGEVIV